MRWMMILPALLVGAPVQAQHTNGTADAMAPLGGGLSGRTLEAAIRKAQAASLGSRDNPVRADMPAGERAYLHRLRCGDGTAPAFSRIGSYGTGVYGYVLDGYRLNCAGAAPVTLFMDMYHDHQETMAPPGFAMATAGD